MSFRIVFILLITSALAELKFRNIKCSSSNISAVVVFCNIKTYSRSFSTYNLGVDVIKRMEKVQVNVSVETKFFGNWRQLAALKNQDYCSMYKDENSPITQFVLRFQHYFQGAVHDCPYEIGPIRLINYTDPYAQKIDELDRKGQLTRAEIYTPRGDFRVKLSIGTYEDPRAFDLMMVFSISYRQADLF